MDDFAHAAFRERRAMHTMRQRALYLHASVWVAVNVFLIVIWAVTGADFPWFVFVLFGWGIGLTAHAASVFWISKPSDILLQQEEKRLATDVAPRPDS